MSHNVTRKLARTIAVVAALAGASLGGASAATLAHHGGYAAASSQAAVDPSTEGSPMRLADDRGDVPARLATRSCIHGHLAHDHC